MNVAPGQDAGAKDPAWRDYRFNALACAIDGAGYGAGISLFSMTTIIPLYMHQLTDRRILFGLLPALYWAGLFLPQLLAARAISHLPRLRRWVMVIAMFERAFLASLIPLTLWLWHRPALLLAAFFVAWAGYAFSTGLNYVAYYGMVAKMIPATRRGRLFGVSGAIGGVLGVGGARLAETLLKDGGMPHGFAWCFAVGIVVLTASVIPLGFVREPAGDPPEEPPHAGLRQIVRLLRADPAFARFVRSHVAYAVAGAAPAFYTVYAIERLGASGGDVARFTALLTAVSVVASPVWGYAADAGGNRRVVIAGAVLVGMGALLALLAPSLTWFYGVFALQAAASAGIGLATGNMLLEFGPPSQAPVYVAVHSSCTMPVMAIAPLVAGALAETAGYRLVFGAGALLAAVAAAGWVTVTEPRGRHP